MEKRKRAAKVSSCSAPFYPVSEKTNARLKLPSLLQEYQELMKIHDDLLLVSSSAHVFPVSISISANVQIYFLEVEAKKRETEAKRKILEKAKQKKLKLRAEVKFLRRKYQSFQKKATGITYRVKRIPETTSLLMESSQPSKPFTRSELSVKDSNLIAKVSSTPRTSSEIDLNQVSLPDEEEIQEFQVHWEPLEIGKLKKHSNEGGALSNNPEHNVLRVSGNGSRSSRAGERKKVTWEDQVALKVVDPFVM